MSDERFEVELARLLASLAAADGEVAPVELEKIRQSVNLSATGFAAIESALAAGQLPEPDYAVLRTNAVATLSAARILVAADGVLADEEVTALVKLKARLA